jgi:uncharacterized protein
LEDLLSRGQVFEYFANAACVIPMQDYPLFEVTRRRIQNRLKPELDKFDEVAASVLRRLESEGPLPSKAFASAEKVHGYWDNTNPKTKATSHVLNLLHDMGWIHVVRREGTTRYFHLKEHAVPEDWLEQANQMSEHECQLGLMDKYLRAYRIFDLGDSRFGWQRLTADERRMAVQQRLESGQVVPLELDGMKKSYFVLSEDVDELMNYQSADGDTSKLLWSQQDVHFLPPLDNLLWRRSRIEEFFDFSYTWEVYTPAIKRQFGYYAMPILVGDQFIGRMDPRLDRSNARLDIVLLQIEPHIRWSKALQKRLLRALEGFAQRHGATLGTIRQVMPESIILDR